MTLRPGAQLMAETRTAERSRERLNYNVSDKASFVFVRCTVRIEDKRKSYDDTMNSRLSIIIGTRQMLADNRGWRVIEGGG